MPRQIKNPNGFLPFLLFLKNLMDKEIRFSICTLPAYLPLIFTPLFNSTASA
jgi:hypothetical protein